MALTSTVSDNILDSLIHIDLSLSTIVEPSRTHRKFAVFFNLTTEDQSVVATKDNLENVIASLDKEQNVNNKISNNIRMWFKSGANELTIINTSKDISTLTNIEPSNLIFVGNNVDQQLGIYSKLPTNVLLKKNVFFSINLGISVEDYPGGRTSYLYLDDKAGSFFNYFAKYTETGYYAKNNFLLSDLEGTNLESLDYIQQYAVGALVYLSFSNGYFYYNIKDRAYYNYNIDVLYQDLEADLRADLFTAIQNNNNAYTDANICRLNNVMSSTMQTYKDRGLVDKFKTAIRPIQYQTLIDQRNGVLRGLEAKYNPTKEIQTMVASIKEEI